MLFNFFILLFWWRQHEINEKSLELPRMHLQHHGFGIDIRKRKIWDSYGKNAKLLVNYFVSPCIFLWISAFGIYKAGHTCRATCFCQEAIVGVTSLNKRERLLVVLFASQHPCLYVTLVRLPGISIWKLIWFSLKIVYFMVYRIDCGVRPESLNLHVSFEFTR